MTPEAEVGTLKSGRPVLGVLVDPVDYDEAVRRVMSAAHESRPYAASALAVHGVMEGALDDAHAFRLNRMDLLVPDGQPVRWMLNARHGAGLRDRVYGPELTLRICAAAARQGLPVGLLGSTPEVLERLVANLEARFPELDIAYRRPSAFRPLTEDEEAALALEVRESGARVVFVGLGCPRQEIFAWENRDRIGLPLVAVGAAFDFHAGTLRQAPRWMQRSGLEWAFRLAMEPRRLWRRYLVLNTGYLLRAGAQILRIRRWDRAHSGTHPTAPQRFG